MMIAASHDLHRAGKFGLLGPTLRALGFAQKPESKRTVDAEVVETLIAGRLAARREKNFKEADRLRDELAAMGVVLKDSKDGTTWEIAR
jgi:cysteinyl-tRNA synthetase